MNPNLVKTYGFRVHNQNFDKLVAYFQKKHKWKGPIAMDHLKHFHEVGGPDIIFH